MENVQADIDKLESAINTFFRTLKRPTTWSDTLVRAKVDIDRPSASILHVLTTHTGTPFRVNDLAEIMGVEAPSITRKTQDLEKAGLVERRPDPNDRRATYVTTTAKGRTVAKRIWQARLDDITKILGGWSPHDRQEFIRLFERFGHDLAAQHNFCAGQTAFKTSPHSKKGA